MKTTPISPITLNLSSKKIHCSVCNKIEDLPDDIEEIYKIPALRIEFMTEYKKNHKSCIQSYKKQRKDGF